MRRKGLEPISGRNSRVLILGTFPGRCSLVAEQYYADPGNQFWEILARVVDRRFREKPHGESPTPLYKRRVNLLRRHRIAVWDILKWRDREGSSDKTLAGHCAEDDRNELGSFLSECPSIERILFNGKTANVLFRRYFSDDTRATTLVSPEAILPSSSSQYANVSLEEKARRWKKLLSSRQ